MNRIEQRFLNALKSDIKIKRITSENIADYAAFLPKTERFNLAYGALNTDGTVCGAVSALMEGEIIEVKSLAVAEEYRRRKVGSSLLCKIKEYADENGIDTVSAEYLADGTVRNDTNAFFRSCGFIIKDGMELISFSATDIAENDSFKKLATVSLDGFCFYPLSKLPAEVKPSFAELCVKPEITGLSPASAKGEIIDELSLAFVNGGEVKAFIVFTDLNGTLYINSAYADPSAPTAIVKLITIAFKTLLDKYKSFERVCVSALNESSLKFIMNFIGTDSGKTVKIFTAAAVCSLSAQLIEDSNFENADVKTLADSTIDGMEILVPRTMRLNDFLNSNGVQSDITILDDGLPALLVTDSLSISIIRYNPADENFSSFNIIAYSYIEANGKNADEACAAFNKAQLFACAVPAEDRDIIVRAPLSEGALPVSENQFMYFYRSFAGSLTLFTAAFAGAPEEK